MARYRLYLGLLKQQVFGRSPTLPRICPLFSSERCSAVQAALEVVQTDASFPGSIGQMIVPIIPAALKATRSGALKGEDLLAAAVKANVRRTVKRLRNSEPSLIEPLRAGKLKIVGAHYDLDDGKVDFFEV